MTLDEKRNAYQQFFIKNEAGQAFFHTLHELIAQNHTAAENDPKQARDYAQRAKGVREVIAHIKSICAEGGKARQ